MIHCFISKFRKVYKLTIKVYGANTNLDKDTQSNWMNRIMIENVTRQSLLAIICMLCEIIYLISTLGRYSLMYEGIINQEYNITVWYIAIIPTWIKILCIYLSFGYTSNSYDKVCSCCHQSLKDRCTNHYRKKFRRQESAVYHELHD